MDQLLISSIFQGQIANNRFNFHEDFGTLHNSCLEYSIGKKAMSTTIYANDCEKKRVKSIFFPPFLLSLPRSAIDFNFSEC